MPRRANTPELAKVVVPVQAAAAMLSDTSRNEVTTRTAIIAKKPAMMIQKIRELSVGWRFAIGLLHLRQERTSRLLYDRHNHAKEEGL